MLSKILKLIDEKGITANKLLVECRLSSNSINAWKNGKAKPSLEAVSKIADYFGVSVDYLIGRTEPLTKPVILPDAFINEWNNSTQKVRDMTYNYMCELNGFSNTPPMSNFERTLIQGRAEALQEKNKTKVGNTTIKQQ